MQKFPTELFVTGTDTGIGKTVVSAMLTAGLNATYWKPVQSGLEGETDTRAVKRLTELPASHFKPETYRLSEPLSPHASAQIDGVTIDMSDFKIPDYSTNHLIIEGAGGVLVPMNDDSMMIDLMAQLNIPALVVARSELGTLNHTFLTLEALRKRHIPILGVIMNGPKNESNRKAIENYGNIDVLAEIKPMDEVNAQFLTKIFDKNF
ncbi:MAG TPA: dethiobiotin synthase [Balneolaceae bacterium]|nr:dethiobiotin synthase [Balneolaceae bacterium]